MEITEIKNRWVKIGNTSITIKNDETGKTAGIVRNICRFLDLQPNKQIDYFKKIKDSGIWRSGKARDVLIADGKMYFLYNTNGMEIQKEHFPEEYKRKIELINKASEYMEVIPVRF